MPTSAPDPKFHGIWIADDGVRYVVKTKDKMYDIMAYDRENTSSEHLKGYFSVIKGATFMNLTNADKPNSSYLIFRVEFKDEDNIKLTEMSEDIKDKFTSPDALRDYIEKNMNNPTFHKASVPPTLLQRE
ncbi:hypothetical protein GCM10023093_04650 [Nemorincola caseinilytica]|uniref:Uncharacterized protein n=2 Tax=Nemorincola caseinilytica TaxID=2054315 RepID=A0ABP8N897_9BACT